MRIRHIPSFRPLRWLPLLAVLTSVFFARPASALPAFARKYETTCQTCHLVYPKLTPFGEAFRRNGYRFPSKGDEVMEKREPVALGSDAQKNLWPDAVYPGTIPHEIPLSVTAQLTAKLGEHFETHGGTEADGHEHGQSAESEKTKLDFGQLGASARLLSGATFGEVSSFFLSISFGEHAPVEVERLALAFYPFEPQHLQIKAGRFEPDLHGISIRRARTPTALHQRATGAERVRRRAVCPRHPALRHSRRTRRLDRRRCPEHGAGGGDRKGPLLQSRGEARRHAPRRHRLASDQQGMAGEERDLSARPGIAAKAW